MNEFAIRTFIKHKMKSADMRRNIANKFLIKLLCVLAGYWIRILHYMISKIPNNQYKNKLHLIKRQPALWRCRISAFYSTPMHAHCIRIVIRRCLNPKQNRLMAK